MCLTEKKAIYCVFGKKETQNKGKRYVLRSVKKDRKEGGTRGITWWKKKEKGKRRRGKREKKERKRSKKNEKERVIHIVIHTVDNFFLTSVEEKKKA